MLAWFTADPLSLNTMKLPPGYAIYRFPSHKSFHDFAQMTGHGSHCQYLEKGVLVGICEIEDEKGFCEARAFARRHGAVRCRKQPKVITRAN